MLLIEGGGGRNPRARRMILGGVLFAVTALLVAIFALHLNPFSKQETVRATFTDVSGVGVVGEDVRMAGVPVGKITDSKRIGDQAVLTMEIDPDDGPIHADATAELRPHLAFEGTAYVEIDPGSPNASELGDDAIPVDQTRVYVPLDEALRVANGDTRKALQGVVHEFAGTFSGAGRRGLQATLRKAPELTSTLADAAGAAQGSHGRELAGTVDGLSATVEAIASKRDRIGPLLRDADATLAALDSQGGSSLDATLAGLPATLDRLRSGSASLDGIVTRLQPLAVDLDPGLEQLAPTLDEALPLVREAGPTLLHARPLIADLRAGLGEGADAAPATKGLLHELRPSLKVLNSSLLPALHRKTDELHVPAYVSFLNLFGGGGGASRPFQTEANANPVQPETGHFMRFGLRFITGVGLPLPSCALLALANPALADALSSAGGCTP
jgi:phospholipid/cholesterol/gamma-HCH transport system substrate-binding protein